MGVNGEALQLHPVLKKCIFNYKSRENIYQVLIVMKIRISTTSHMRIGYCKSRAPRLNMQ